VRGLVRGWLLKVFARRFIGQDCEQVSWNDWTRMSDEKPADVLSKVLSYVDSPFKLFALILMAVFAFSGYFLWQNQGFLFEAYKENKKLPTIAEDRVEDVAAHLFKNSDATVVAIFKVNPLFGTRILFRAYTREGRDKTHDGLDVGLFTQSVANNHDVIALMANEIPCGEYARPQSEIGLWYIDKGVTFGCRVSVPPEQGRFVGQITVGWDKEPKDLNKAISMLQIASSMLSRSKQ
jgi:hypothetical protein